MSRTSADPAADMQCYKLVADERARLMRFGCTRS
jgi:hypothetical protein